MVSVIAPLTEVRFSPQVFVFSLGLGLILVDHIKFADTVSPFNTSFEYARRYDASVAEVLGLYHIYFWSYIVLLHFA